MAKAAWWRNEKRNAQRFVLVQSKSQTVDAARAQNRKGRIAGLAPRISQSLRAKWKPLSGPGRRDGLGTDGRQGVGPRDQFRPLTEPAPARAPGEWKPTLNARKSFSEPASRRRAAKYPSGSTSRREWGRPQGRPHFSFWASFVLVEALRIAPRGSSRLQGTAEIRHSCLGRPCFTADQRCRRIVNGSRYPNA